MMMPSPRSTSSIARTDVLWHTWPRIFAEELAPPPEPLALLLRGGGAAPPASVVRLAARALIGERDKSLPWPAWLAPHQVRAARRLDGILERHGGALLADAVGLGKSYVSLGVAVARCEPFALVVPAVLVDQWRALLARYHAQAPLLTHEALSRSDVRLTARPPVRLFIVDEAHRFRNRSTRRYRALAKLVVGARVLLVTATPVHNRLEDLFRLFHLFLRDDALTALGLPSLNRAGRCEGDPELVRAAISRLIVARSRRRVRSEPGNPMSLSFPKRAPGRVIRAGPLPDLECAPLIAAVRGLTAGAGEGALFRLLLLTRLSSSVAAFGDSLRRYQVYLEMALKEGEEGRALGPREFQRVFPDRESDALQLALFPPVVTTGPIVARPDDLAAVRRLRAHLVETTDPKAALLEDLLATQRGKTIVFTGARATARYLARRFLNLRVAVVFGDHGLLGGTRATRREILRAFAPRAQEAPPPCAALETQILIATDILSEGVNLQDAIQVVHYDLPWSPARLAQRVGRIDRLGSLNNVIETVTFLPPRPLANALRLEERLAAKVLVQVAASAGVETVRGATESGAFDWCDRLDPLARRVEASASPGAWAAVSGKHPAVVLVVRLGALVEAIVVDASGARADPARATALLEYALQADAGSPDRAVLERAIERAGPLLRSRLAAIADARWRAGDRDRLGRRLIPWALTAARSAARCGDAAALTRLDALISRLARGMTAGEDVLLEELVEDAKPLSAGSLLAWHERLPPPIMTPEASQAELVAALIVTGPSPR
jgi:superfamily II DNA or RNA helicase